MKKTASAALAKSKHDVRSLAKADLCMINSNALGGKGGVTAIQPCERIEYHDATDAING
jgi:hypothetical protein